MSLIPNKKNKGEKMDVNQLQRKLKVETIGEEGTWAEIAGSPRLEFNDEGSPSGKVLIPVRLGGNRIYDFKGNSDSVDKIAEVLGDETTDWLYGEIFIKPTSAKFGKELVSWLVAVDARSTKRRDSRLEGLKLDAQNSRLG